MTLRVLFLVNSLCVGGAEKHVVSLVNGLDATRHRLALTALKREEALLPQIAPHRLADGLACLDVAQGLSWGAVRRLARQLDAQRTDVLVCTNMYALLYGWLARALSRRGPQVRLVEEAATALSMCMNICGSPYGHVNAIFCRLSFMRLFWNQTLMVLSVSCSSLASSQRRGRDT